MKVVLRNFLLTWAFIVANMAMAGLLSLAFNRYMDKFAFNYVWNPYLNAVSQDRLDAHHDRVMLFLLVGGLAGIAMAQAIWWRSAMDKK